MVELLYSLKTVKIGFGMKTATVMENDVVEVTVGVRSEGNLVAPVEVALSTLSRTAIGNYFRALRGVSTCVFAVAINAVVLCYCKLTTLCLL